MTAYDYLAACTDGLVIGPLTTSKVAMMGGTPTSRLTAPTAVGTTAATSTTPYGFGTTTQANAIVTAVNTLISNLTATGWQA